MKKQKRPQTTKEIDARILDLKEDIENENVKITALRNELKQKEDDIEQNIRERETAIQEYKLLLKHYQEERILVSNPSSRNGEDKK